MSKKPSDQVPNYWLRTGLLTLSEKVVSMVFNLGTAMLLLRMLPKESFATWGIFTLLTYLVEMGRSGLLQNGLIRALAVHKQDAATCSKISMAAWTINIAYSALAILLVWLGSDWIIAQYQIPLLTEMLPAYFLVIVVLGTCMQFNFIQQAHFEFRGQLWTAVFYRGIPFLWVLGCWMTTRDIQLAEFSVALLAGCTLATLGTWWFSRPFLHRGKRLDLHWVANLLGYGKFVLGTNISTMLYKNMDKLVLGKLLGPLAYAVYDAAARVTQLVEAPAFSIAAVVFPKSAESMASEGEDGIKNLYERSVGATLAVILPFVIVVLLFAEPIIRVFAGAQYLDAANVLRLTAFFGLFLPYAVQFGTVLDSSGLPAVNFAYTTFTVLLNLLLSVVFIRSFGLFGAAYGTLTGYALSFILMQRYLYKKFRINALNAFVYLPRFYVLAFRLVRLRNWFD